jgi:hypothetical protein
MSLAELQSDVRHLGIGRALVRSAYYRANHLCGLRVYQFMAMLPDYVSRDLLERKVRYDCRILEAHEVRDLARDPDNGLAAPWLSDALAKGGLCFGILDGDVLASFGWYTNQPCSVFETVTLSFDRRYLYMYAGYTQPAYRGENLHGIGLARACITLCARGHPGIVTIAERVNFASLRSAHRVGFRDCGMAIAVGKGDRVRVRQTRTPEQYALRVTPLAAVARGSDSEPASIGARKTERRES